MMAEPVLLNTPRGRYRLVLLEQAGTGPWVLTVSVEHAGGLEKFAFRCLLSQGSLQRLGIDHPSAACAGMAGWVEREFETVREAALKSIRTERRLTEFSLDSSASIRHGGGGQT